MQSPLARRIAGIAITSLAIAFIFFSIHLLQAVNAAREELYLNGRLITQLGRLELGMRTLEELLSGTDPVAAGTDHSERLAAAVKAVEAQINEINWEAERLGALRTLGPRLHALDQQLAEPDTNVRLTNAEIAVTRRMLRGLADAQDITIESIRDRQGALSVELNVRWDQLSWLVGVSCLLAVLAGILVQLYHHSLARQEQAQEAERYLAAIVESSDDAIVGKSVDGVVQSWNGGAEHMFGWTAAEIIGRSIELCVPRNRHAEVLLLHAAVQRGESVNRYETQRLRKDGTLIDVSLTLSPILDDHDRIVGVSTVAQDITDRCRAERALAREHELLEQFTRRQAALAEMELAINERAELQSVLDRVAQLAGELLPASAGASVLLWDKHAQAFVVSSTSVPGQSPEEPARRVRRQGGATRWIVDHQQPLIVPDVAQDPFGANPMLPEAGIQAYAGVPLIVDNAVVGVLFAMDRQPRTYSPDDVDFMSALAGRAAVAVSRVGLYERLRSINLLLRSSRDALQAKNRELEEFASVASHDLREPLRIVQMFGERLHKKLADRLTPAEQDHLARMLAATERMRQLIDDLLALARITMKGQPFVSVDLNTVADEVVANLGARLTDGAAHVDVGSLPTIHADPAQMRQLLQNLMSNALKFHRPGEIPEVRVSAGIAQDSAGEPWCELRVADHGIGIDARDAERVFNMFERLHSRSAYEGTGMGLAICRRIVERHGGSICIDTAQEVGTTFVVTVPVTPHAFVEPTVAPLAQEAAAILVGSAHPPDQQTCEPPRQEPSS